MAQATASIYHFNRGIISRLAHARVDIKRTAFSAEQMTNWMPRVLGSMMLRPGLQYIGQTGSSNVPRLLPFIFAVDDTALIELCDGNLRVWVNDVLVTRNAVSTAITNGTFSTNLTGWTDDDEAGATSSWAVGGFMQLVGTGTNAAIREQAVTVAAADQGVEHALRILISRGPVTLRIGSTSGGDEYVSETELATGTHSLAFTPTGDFYVRFQSRLERITLVDSCTVEAAGTMSIPVPWLALNVRLVRADQSGDILFLACKGFQQRKIERRATHSWSVVIYQSNDGPFRVENTGPMTIAPSALSGNVVLAASSAYFTSTQVGGLIRHRSVGQRVSADIIAQNTFTNSVRVIGVGEQRRYTWQISGAFVGTVTVQRSVGTVGFWEDVATRTGDANESDNDGLDNQVVYYRIGIKTGDYTSGTATCTITYTLGSITGVARITAFTSSTSVNAEVLTDFGSVDPSLLWSEGSWSDRRGWPSSVSFYEGRLWWAGKANIWGSVSDAFDSFSPDIEGDAGPINRTIGSGPVDSVNWLLPLQRLIAGAPGAEHSVRSTTFDEPLSPTNFNIKEATTQGSASVPAVKIDARGVFVQKSGSRIFELAFDTQAYDYGATDITALVPEICRPSVVAMAVQRQPDTRIHCVLSNGKVAVCVFDRVESVMSWQIVETDGDVEDVAVLPGTEEDAVYYVVNRAVGATGLVGITVTNAGSGYLQVPTFTFSGVGQNTVVLSALSRVSQSVAVGGISYLVGDVVRTPNNEASFTVSTVDASGAITALTGLGGVGIEAPAVAPENPVALHGGAGSGASVNIGWGVDLLAIAVTNPGYGFTEVPTVTITSVDGYGSGATATAIWAAAGAPRSRRLERWALESECSGGVSNKQADSFTTYNGIPASTITGLDHLAGKEVVIWGDGIDLSPDDDDQVQRTYTVSAGGTATLDVEVSNAVVGVPYKGIWVSTKLANALGQDSALNQRKRISQLGLILVDTHARGLRFGNSNGGPPAVLDDLPLIEAGAEIDADFVYTGYDADMIEFPGEWATDNRLWLEARAPRPCTVLAATMAIEAYEKR